MAQYPGLRVGLCGLVMIVMYPGLRIPVQDAFTSPVCFLAHRHPGLGNVNCSRPKGRPGQTEADFEDELSLPVTP